MSTAMVVTTVITADADMEKVKTLTLEQIRNNDRGLLNNLLDWGVDARVTTAILNLDEFLEYVHLRQRKAAAPAPSEPTSAQTSAQTTEKPIDPQGQSQSDALSSATLVITDDMSEIEFMEYTLQQLSSGEHQPFVALREEEVEAMEEEHIGQHLSHHPFLY